VSSRCITEWSGRGKGANMYNYRLDIYTLLDPHCFTPLGQQVVNETAVPFRIASATPVGEAGELEISNTDWWA
jgi:hypothetical protein